MVVLPLFGWLIVLLRILHILSEHYHLHSFCIWLFCYWFSKIANLLHFSRKEKYKNKELDAITIEEIQQKILLIGEKELFLNPNLTLDETAKEMKTSKHLLSQYLNEKLGKSFTNFINEYRIEKAKELLQHKNNYTIEGLGYECGFNSKSTFLPLLRE